MSESFCGSINTPVPNYNSHTKRPSIVPETVHIIPSLDELLHEKSEDVYYNRANFVAYLTNIHCLENLEFIMDLNEYLHKKTDDWRPIHEKFLRPNAPSEINLPFKLKELLIGKTTAEKAAGVPGPTEEILVKVKRFVYDDVLINLYNEFVKYMRGKSGESVYRRRSEIDTSVSKTKVKEDPSDEILIPKISRQSTDSSKLSADSRSSDESRKGSRSARDSPTELFRGSSIFSRRVSRDSKMPDELYRIQAKYTDKSRPVDPQNNDPEVKTSDIPILQDSSKSDIYRSRRSRASVDFSPDPLHEVNDAFQRQSLRESRSPSLVDLRRSPKHTIDQGTVGQIPAGTLGSRPNGSGDTFKVNHQDGSVVSQSESLLLFIIKPSLSSSQYYHDLLEDDDSDNEENEPVIRSGPTTRSNSSSSHQSTRGSSIGSLMDSFKNNVEGMKIKNVRKFKFSRRFSNDN